MFGLPEGRMGVKNSWAGAIAAAGDGSSLMVKYQCNRQVPMAMCRRYPDAELRYVRSTILSCSLAAMSSSM